MVWLSLGARVHNDVSKNDMIMHACCTNQNIIARVHDDIIFIAEK